ncbi:MAG: hypothetical protein R3C11_20830 [Planctomycetaceae bacterium]
MTISVILPLARPPPKVLIVSGTPAEGVTLQNALAPPKWRENNIAPYDCELIRQESLLSMSLEELEKFDNICLINIAEPRAEIWTQLEKYVSQGGGFGRSGEFPD